MSKAKGLTDEFSQRVSKAVLQDSNKTPEELARFWAEQGQPQYAADYLVLSDLSEHEQNAILATAYEKSAERKDWIAASLEKTTDKPSLYRQDAEAARQKAKVLRGE